MDRKGKVESVSIAPTIILARFCNQETVATIKNNGYKLMIIVYIMKGRIEDLKNQIIIICVQNRTAVVTVPLNEPVEIPRRFCKTK